MEGRIQARLEGEAVLTRDHDIDSLRQEIIPEYPEMEPGTRSAASDLREPPLCESKNCPNRAIGLVEDRRGVKWAACEKHAREVLNDA